MVRDGSSGGVSAACRKRRGRSIISPTTARRSLKSHGSKGDNKGKEKEKSGKRQLGGMRTRSQGPICDGQPKTLAQSDGLPETVVESDGLPETLVESDGLLETSDVLPDTSAELLHLEQHHFATGWSGRIVRGTYEGQSIVVKLAPVGSDRAEALLTEVRAYHMLKEFWGKYVPQLVSYGTTVKGTIMYIATEEIRGYEIGMGPLSQEVVDEIFDALAFVHQRGILHGDIRPSNILVVQGQQVGVRFIDFGFARFVNSDGGRDKGHRRENAQLVSLVSEFNHLFKC